MFNTTSRSFRFFIAIGIAVFVLANHFAGAVLSDEEIGQKSKTLKFFIFQNPAVLLNGNSTTTLFSVFIGENNPIVKDAYIELRGVASAGSGQITVDINQSDSFPTSRQQSFQIDSTGKPNYFKLLYSGSATASTTPYFAGIITNPGTYNFYLKTSVSGANFSLVQARMVITYEFTPPSNGGGVYPATGYIISPIFDTGAVNGVEFNSIKAVGTTPIGTKVRIQFATASSSAGPWNYLGSNCDTATYYYDSVLSSPAQSKEIGCFNSHNNKRYFRYKAIFCSSSDCATCSGGSDCNATPQIDDVIVNWSL